MMTANGLEFNARVTMFSRYGSVVKVTRNRASMTRFSREPWLLRWKRF